MGKNYKRFLFSFLISLLFATSLGLILMFWAILSPEANSNTTLADNLSSLKKLSISDLWRMGFILIALSVSTYSAVLITPLAFWAMRTGKENLMIYGSVLWLLLAIFIIFGIPSILLTVGGNRFFCMFLLSALGLLAIGLIPPRKQKP